MTIFIGFFSSSSSIYSCLSFRIFFCERKKEMMINLIELEIENRFVYQEMENKFISDDFDQIESDAIRKLRRWRKKMFTEIDQIYVERLNEIQMKIQQKRDEKNTSIEDFVLVDPMPNQPEEIFIVLPSPNFNEETRLEKIFQSEAVKEILNVGLTQAASHFVQSTTTVATATIVKTALIHTTGGMTAMAYGLGKLVQATAKKFWSR